MWRNILAGVVGYIVMVTLTGLWILLLLPFFPGILQAAQAGRTPPTLYIFLNLAGGFVAAIAGGAVCMAIARDRFKVALQLASIVCLLAVLYAWQQWGGVQPGWYLLALAVTGPAGIVLGAVLRRRWKSGRAVSS